MTDCFVIDSDTPFEGDTRSPQFIHFGQLGSEEAYSTSHRTRHAQERLERLGSRRALFLSSRASPDHLTLAAKIKESRPERQVIFGTDQLDLEPAIRALRLGQVDVVVRTADPVEAALQVHTRGTAQPEILTLWRGKQGTIEWNREREAAPSEGPRTLLVLMPAWNNDFAPSGLAHISAALKAAGNPVDVLDLNFEFWRQLRHRFRDTSEYGSYLLWTNRQSYEAEARPELAPIFTLLREAVQTGKYAYVGFSLFETTLNASVDAFALIRECNPEIKIFCGGPSCELDGPFPGKRALEENRVDALVIGEGEVSAVDLVAAWNRGEDRPVPGTYRRVNGSICEGGSRPLANINTLPAPDFSGFPVYNYDRFELPAYFSRGCVARCTFCSETEFWVRFRILAPERVVDMMEGLIRDYGIRRFRFTDSLLNGSHRHLEKFADLVIERAVSVTFYGYCRLDNDLSAPLLKKLAQAGCVELAFGMESGSQRVTELMRKEVDVSKYERIIKDSSLAGIRNLCCVIVGFPGESWRDFFQTVRKVLGLRRFIDTLNLSVPTLGKIHRSKDDMESLGIHPGQLAADRWRTTDGTNTPKIRMIRFWLLQTLWRLAKKKRLAPSWIYRPA